MRKTIFELEIRVDLNHELKKLRNKLHEEDFIYYNNNWITFERLIDLSAFKDWEYRGTCFNVKEYLNRINFNFTCNQIEDDEGIVDDHTSVLHYFEFILNMKNILRFDIAHYQLANKSVFENVFENIDIILEQLNYKYKVVEDKIIVVKRNADVDSVLGLVPENIASLLLHYIDFSIKDDLEAKKDILKNIDLYIENNKKMKSYVESSIWNKFQKIVNKMGVNHPIDEEYKDYSEQEIIKEYDNCFLLMIHTIRSYEIKTKIL